MSSNQRGHLFGGFLTDDDVATVQRHLSKKHRLAMVFDGALIGLVGGCVVTLYRLALSNAEALLHRAIGDAGQSPIGIAGWFCVLALILATVCALMMWEPYTVSSGIPQTEAEVAGQLDMPWHRVMFAKFAEGTLCTFAGLSLGREGPSIQLGGMAGKAVAKLLHKDRGDERVLVTCGAASGMAAAFHAPLTGVMFALEEIHKIFSAPVIVGVMMASIVSDCFVSQVLGVRPTISFVFLKNLPHVQYLFVVLMGVALGVLGALHNQGMFKAQEAFSHIRRGGPFVRLLIPFALAGLIAFTFHQLLCGGDGIIEVVRNSSAKSLAFLVILLIAKYAFTSICFGSGAPGGTLLPLVVMGALSGCIFGNVFTICFGINQAFLTNFIVLGIAGLFASVVRAPITGIVLVFELTGSLDSLLSASIVTMAAYVTADLIGIEPFYERLLAKLLCNTGEDAKASFRMPEKILHEHVVETGSTADGSTIRDIPWPDKCLVVTVVRSGAEYVPTGEMKLQALDRLIIIMNESNESDSEKGIRRVCRGTVI